MEWIKDKIPGKNQFVVGYFDDVTEPFLIMRHIGVWEFYDTDGLWSPHYAPLYWAYLTIPYGGAGAI